MTGEPQTSHRPRPKQAQNHQVTPGNTWRPHSPLVPSQVLSSLGGGGVVRCEGLLSGYVAHGQGLRGGRRKSPASEQHEGRVRVGAPGTPAPTAQPLQTPSRNHYTREGSWLRKDCDNRVNTSLFSIPSKHRALKRKAALETTAIFPQKNIKEKAALPTAVIVTCLCQVNYTAENKSPWSSQEADGTLADMWGCSPDTCCFWGGSTPDPLSNGAHALHAWG